MKTTRRQELRTNELSQQIDQAGEYVKQNATIFTVIIVALAGLVAGGFWYSNHQGTVESDAWARLGPPEPTDDTMTVIDRYQAVADERVNSALTTAALLRIGDLALARIGNPPPPSEGTPQAAPDAAELTAKARAAFERVIADASVDVAAYGHAMMAMGVIEENATEFGKAREWYDRLVGEKRLADTPFKSEADYRLAGLETWSQAVVFPAPPPMEPGPPAPLSLDAPADLPITSPGTKIERLKPGDPRIPPLGEVVQDVKEIPIKVEPTTATENPATETPKPAPTTQPAGN